MGYRPFQADLSGRVALVTGANSGMGNETARELARMGAGSSRLPKPGKRRATANDIIETTGQLTGDALPQRVEMTCQLGQGPGGAHGQALGC